MILTQQISDVHKVLTKVGLNTPISPVKRWTVPRSCRVVGCNHFTQSPNVVPVFESLLADFVLHVPSQVETGWSEVRWSRRLRNRPASSWPSTWLVTIQKVLHIVSALVGAPPHTVCRCSSQICPWMFRTEGTAALVLISAPVGGKCPASRVGCSASVEKPPVPTEAGRSPKPIWKLWRRDTSLARTGSRTTAPWSSSL